MFEDEVPNKKCPKCDKNMQKLIYRKTKSSPSGKLLYMCNSCNYFVKGKNIDKIKKYLIEKKQPTISSDKSLEDWRWKKKWEAIPKLRAEAKKQYKQITKKYGIITDNDILNLKIDLWEFGHKKKKKEEK